MAEKLTIKTLEHWALAGAHWRVLHHGEPRSVVELQQCTGELVERLESDDPAVIAYLQGAESDLDVIHEGSRR
jgi:DNA-binding ferritin-like protein